MAERQLETVDAVCILFRREVPEGFLRFIAERQESLYEEALAQCRENPRLKTPEISALAGHAKRAFFEALLRDAAKVNDMPYSDEKHAGGNLGFVSANSGRFRMTAHRVSWPGELVRPSVSRKQAAAVNDYVGQLVIEFGDLCPYPKLAEAKEINAYILHGDYGNNTPFLRVAIPDANLTKYHVNVSLEHLMQDYLEDSRRERRPDATKDRRKPRTKKSQSDKEKEGGSPE